MYKLYTVKQKMRRSLVVENAVARDTLRFIHGPNSKTTLMLKLRAQQACHLQ
jgi:hypothetical protein